MILEQSAEAGFQSECKTVACASHCIAKSGMYGTTTGSQMTVGMLVLPHQHDNEIHVMSRLSKTHY